MRFGDMKRALKFPMPWQTFGEFLSAESSERVP